jgi:hypothetical protein
MKSGRKEKTSGASTPTPSPVPARSASLTDDALEDAVVEHLLAPLRIPRAKLRDRTGRDDQTLEEVLLRLSVRARVAAACNAYASEKLISLLRALINGAEKHELWAWKILLEALGFEEHLRAAVNLQPYAECGGTALNEIERDILEAARALMRARGAGGNGADSSC